MPSLELIKNAALGCAAGILIGALAAVPAGANDAGDEADAEAAVAGANESATPATTVPEAVATQGVDELLPDPESRLREQIRTLHRGPRPDGSERMLPSRDRAPESGSSTPASSPGLAAVGDRSPKTAAGPSSGPRLHATQLALLALLGVGLIAGGWRYRRSMARDRGRGLVSSLYLDRQVPGARSGARAATSGAPHAAGKRVASMVRTLTASLQGNGAASIPERAAASTSARTAAPVSPRPPMPDRTAAPEPRMTTGLETVFEDVLSTLESISGRLERLEAQSAAQTETPGRSEAVPPGEPAERGDERHADVRPAARADERETGRRADRRAERHAQRPTERPTQRPTEHQTVRVPDEHRAVAVVEEEMERELQAPREETSRPAEIHDLHRQAASPSSRRVREELADMASTRDKVLYLASLGWDQDRICREADVRPQEAALILKSLFRSATKSN